MLCVRGRGWGGFTVFAVTAQGRGFGRDMCLCRLHVFGASVCVEGSHRCVRAVQGWRERVACSFAEVGLLCAIVRALCVGVGWL